MRREKKYHIRQDLTFFLFFLASACNLWEDPNNNSASYLYLEAVRLGTTIVVTMGVIYMKPCFFFFISLFFVPATLLCGVLLVDDCNRHQFAWRWQTGITNHNLSHTHKEGEKTMAGQIGGSGGDESPLDRGEKKEGDTERALYSFITQTLN